MKNIIKLGKETKLIGNYNVDSIAAKTTLIKTVYKAIYYFAV